MKYKCLICGQIFEVLEGQEAICPVCKAKGATLFLMLKKS